MLYYNLMMGILILMLLNYYSRFDVADNIVFLIVKTML